MQVIHSIKCTACAVSKVVMRENLNSNLRVYTAGKGRHDSAGSNKFPFAEICGVQFNTDNKKTRGLQRQPSRFSGDPWENRNSNLRVYVAGECGYGRAGSNKFSQTKICGVRFRADNE